jgi:hypothetical protein
VRGGGGEGLRALPSAGGPGCWEAAGQCSFCAAERGFAWNRRERALAVEGLRDFEALLRVCLRLSPAR